MPEQDPPGPARDSPMARRWELLAVATWLLLVALRAIQFRVWDQILAHADVPPWDVDLLRESHGLRYLLMYPVLKAAAALGMEVNVLFGTVVVGLLYATARWTDAALERALPDAGPRPFRRLGLVAAWLAVSLAMNGRLAFAFCGMALACFAVARWRGHAEAGTASGWRLTASTLALLAAGTALASVSSGTFVAVAASWVAWFGVQLARGRGLFQKAGWTLPAALALLAVAALPLVALFVQKNVAFHGGGVLGAVQMLGHGPGSLLLPLGLPGAAAAYAAFALLALAAAILLARRDPPLGILWVAGGCAAVLGAFGYSTLAVGLVPALAVAAAGRRPWRPLAILLRPGSPSGSPSWRKGLAGAGLAVGLAILLGRVAGFVRDAALAATYGVTSSSDLAVLALTVPDLLVTLLVGGALSAVLVPEFHHAPDRAARDRLAGRAFGWVLAAGTAACLALALAAGPVLRALGPGLPEAARAEGAFLLRVVSLSVPLSAATGVASAYLQARGRFWAASSGTLLFNVGVTAALVAAAPQVGLLAVAVGVVGAAALRLLYQGGAAAAAGYRPSASAWKAPPGLVRRYAQGIAAGTLLALLLPVLGRAFASLAGPGAMSAFTYAGKLAELPVGILASVLGFTLLPRLSRAAAAGEAEVERGAVRQGCWVLLAATVPAAVALAVFAPGVAALAFQRGLVGGDEAGQIAALTRIAAWGMPGAALCAFLFSPFAARRDLRTPLFGVLGAAAAFAALGWPAVRGRGTAGLVALGVAVQTALALWMLAALRARHGIDARAGMAGTAAKALLAAVAPTAVAWMVAGAAGPAAQVVAGMAAGLASMGILAVWDPERVRTLRRALFPA